MHVPVSIYIYQYVLRINVFSKSSLIQGKKT